MDLAVSNLKAAVEIRKDTNYGSYGNANAMIGRKTPPHKTFSPVLG